MLKYNTTTREHRDGHERTIGDHRALDVPIVKLVPSNGGVMVREGGFGPAPSNVTTGVWRALSYAGMALAISKAASRRATEVVKIIVYS